MEKLYTCETCGKTKLYLDKNGKCMECNQEKTPSLSFYSIDGKPFATECTPNGWIAYKIDKWTWNIQSMKKIPCFTRSEEKAFPKKVAKTSSVIYQNL